MRSKRPGRRRAWSTSHGWFVAPRTNTSSLTPAKPSSLGEQLGDDIAAGRSAQLAAAHPDGVELVEEHHARRPPPGGLEMLWSCFSLLPNHMSRTSLSSTGVNEASSLAGQCPGQVGLAASRRSVQEHSAAQAAAELSAQLGYPQRAEEAQLQPALDVGQTSDVAQPDPPVLVLGHDVAEERVELVELLVC